MNKQNKIYDIEKVKEEAALSVHLGAVTYDYQLNVEEACSHLNSLLASEIMCSLRYRQHETIAKGMANIFIASEFKEHAEQEEKHMLLFAHRIQDLGGTPNFDPDTIAKRSATDFGKATDIREMIYEDLVAERVAVQIYRNLIHWFGNDDPTTRRLLEDLLRDEEEHASDFSDLLADDKKSDMIRETLDKKKQLFQNRIPAH